ncbi:MAG: hypothetical protein ACI91O_000604 [Candidatus Poriferisodalaceae bacterium]|jgi:hypothetical protein
MSPTAQRVVFSAVVIVVAIGGLFALAWGPASDRDVSNLGPDEFRVNARTIRDAAPEGPVFFGDPIDEGRDIYVSHAGSTTTSGYVAYSARGTSGCLLQLDREIGDLVDTCDGTRYSSTGERLDAYPVRYLNDRLFIDLNFRERAAQETTS